ncbi:hypothetical protein Taro_033478 [Colocasia esculenta]|uniref:peptidylprolyl isomerase n=1 Tax=Colocasia esculenta TaxID=4460 RepID=A0A843W736_COLES|nr:hypothetical protein [Colocasia esculenta]
MGVEKQILRAGTGPKPAKGQNVTVHCTGFGKGGDLSQKFWSTKDPGQKPFTFKIGQGSVIKGSLPLVGKQSLVLSVIPLHYVDFVSIIEYLLPIEVGEY